MFFYNFDEYNLRFHIKKEKMFFEKLIKQKRNFYFTLFYKTLL